MGFLRRGEPARAEAEGDPLEAARARVRQAEAALTDIEQAERRAFGDAQSGDLVVQLDGKAELRRLALAREGATRELVLARRAESLARATALAPVRRELRERYRRAVLALVEKVEAVVEADRAVAELWTEGQAIGGAGLEAAGLGFDAELPARLRRVAEATTA